MLKWYTEKKDLYFRKWKDAEKRNDVINEQKYKDEYDNYCTHIKQVQTR